MKPIRRFLSSRSQTVPRRQAVIQCCLGGALALSAGAVTWDGGDGTVIAWSEVTNWSDDTLPASGADVLFSGSANFNLYPANDLAAGFALNSITFDATAESYELTGSAVDFNGKTITNNSPNPQSVFMPLQETGTGITAESTGGHLILGDINTSGFGRVFTKNGGGTVETQASNNSWRLVQNAGTLVWGSNILFGTHDLNGGTLSGKVPGIFHFNATLRLNNTTGTSAMSMAQDSISTFTGSGVTKLANLTGAAGSVITNHASTGQLATLTLRGATGTFAGSIQDGPDIVGEEETLQGAKTQLWIRDENVIQTFTLSGPNTYTGDTRIDFDSTLVLGETGSLTFKIEPGLSNKVYKGGGAGVAPAVTFNGTFNIDLTEAGTPADGASWTLVDAANLTETYGPTFAVAAPFAETSPGSGVWTHSAGGSVYTFSEATGQLSYGRIPLITWTGGATPDGNWSNAANWSQAPQTGDDIIFAGTTNLAANNDLDTGWDAVNSVPGAFVVDSLKFDATAGAFVIGGNDILFDNKTLLNESAATQTINNNLWATNALSVDTPAGNVVLGGSLNTTAGFNKPFTKTGAGTLVLNGTQNTSWALNVNGGTLQVFNGNAAGQVMGFSGNIAAGATLLTESNDVFHGGASVTVNGTLNLGANEALGSISGSGIVTNHGDGSGVTTLTLGGGAATQTWNGAIKDGGNVTAVDISGAARLLNFGGINTYTGDTTLTSAEPSLTLTSTSSLIFKPGDNGDSNKISCTGSYDDGGGNLIPGQSLTAATVFDGKFILNLAGAAVVDGNSWTLVDAATLNETYGATFQLVNSAYVPPTEYRVNSGTGTFGTYGEDDTYASAGGNYANTNTIDTSGVTNPAPVEAYQSERNGNFTYTFPGLGAGAAYTVRLHFAEIYHNAVGLRRFNVLINGTQVLTNYDIFATAGAKNKAVVEEIPVTAGPAGTIAIQFATVTDGAKVSAVEIVPVGGGSGSTFVEAADVWTMVDGSNTWTFTEATGVLSVSSGGGSNNYATWASANGIPGEPASGDFDKDGLTNLMEYALGLSPTASSVPAGNYAGGAVSFAKGADAVANGDVTWAIEESDDLGVTDPWTIVTPTVNNSSTISYTLPTGKPKVFVRLLVGQP